MKKINQTLLSALCLSAVCLMALACSDTDTAQTDITKTTDAVTEAVTEYAGDDRRNYPDKLPEADLEGYAYRVYVSTADTKYYLTEEATGEIIEDSIYNRNRAVEERYNIDLQIVDSGYDNVYTQTEGLQKQIMAGDDFADLVEIHSVVGGNLSLTGYLFDLYELEHVDFTQPWWFPQTVEEMTFMDKMFMGCSTISYKALSTVTVGYVNLDLWNTYDLSDTYGAIYDLVADNKWTLETMDAATKVVYRDLNGDGKRDPDDEYGHVLQVGIEGYWTAFDAPILKKHEDSLEVVANNEKVVAIVEKMYDHMYNNESTYIVSTMASNGMPTNLAEIFSHGAVLYVETSIAEAGGDYLRNAEFDYGILPQPKYDEAQKQYRCFAEGAYMAVPITNTNLSRTGLIYEALNAEGYRQIIPAYEETALKDKYLRDEESGRMFDLVLESYTASFAFNYDNWEGFAHLFGKIFNETKGNKDIVSYLEKNMKKAVRRADKVAQGFLDYGAN